MPPITALLHARNDARHLGRALESLRPCDQFVGVDHGSTDGTSAVARQYGALVTTQADALASVTHDWVLVIEPREALSEALEGALYQWKQADPGDTTAFAVRLREETPAGWELRPAEIRLQQRSALPGTGAQPPKTAGAPLLEGDLLRFRDTSVSSAPLLRDV